MAAPSKETIDRIIGGDTEELIRTAEEWGEELAAGGLSRSQFRNFFAPVKSIQMRGFTETDYPRLLLLKPKLAYNANRPGSTLGMKELGEVLKTAIDCVGKDSVRFDNFFNFFEAVLAYHRASEGKSRTQSQGGRR